MIRLSAYDGRFKFIYPCKGGYPCAQENLAWLYSLGHTTGEHSGQIQTIVNFI